MGTSPPSYFFRLFMLFQSTTITRLLYLANANLSAIQNFATRATAAPPHPQQNENSSQIAAAAWLGFAKPNPCRTTSPTTKSTTHQPSAALDGLQHPFSYKHSLRTSLAGNLQSSHFRQVLCSIPIDLKTPNYPRH